MFDATVEHPVPRISKEATGVLLTAVSVSVGLWLYFAPATAWLLVLPIVFALGLLRWKLTFYSVVLLIPFTPFVEFGLPVHDLASCVRFALFFGVLANRLYTGNFEFKLRGKVTRALMLYFLIAIASVTVFNPIGGPLAASSLLRLISYACFYATALWFLECETDVRTVLKLLFISTICVDLFSFYQFAVRDYSPVYRFLYPPSDAEHTIEAWAGRAPSVFVHFNTAAGYLNLVEPFALALWVWDRCKLALACALLTGFAILATQSRGGILALGITLLVLLRLKSRSFFRFSLRVTALALVAVPAIWAIAELFPRVISGDSSPEFRPLIWAAAVVLWKSHPAFGIGWGNFRMMYGSLLPFANPEIMDAHNVYFQVLAETGIVGIVAFVLLICQSFMATWSAAKTRNAVAAGCFCAIVSVMTHGFADCLFHVGPPFMALLMLVFAIVTLNNKDALHTASSVKSLFRSQSLLSAPELAR